MSKKKKLEKLVPTAEEIADSKARLLVFNPGYDYDAANKKAHEEGFKDEKCPKCNVVFLACIHYIRCAAEDCPMKDKSGESLLDQVFGEEIKKPKDDK